MTYTKWFHSHADKHKNIVAKLSARNYTPEQIINYFEFDNMVRTENDFCLLYAMKTKCHDIPHLNCYWCACPYFRFNDNATADNEGNTLFSYCAINAPQGKSFQHENKVHHDCSDCTVSHDTKTILKNFSTDWKETMKACNLTF
ncbi:MAG: hypothetical protein PHI47_07495 [Sulfuricurvum sp.]|uniref:hypothetical protein n=1 Tax=Sulfuricurvum sp. TaxID=2025608 RepID=UPI00260D0B0A|nr:hypothetical protein [Sulfuricurvum sp.]MDD5159875.1 hypothetical protein [Sulfuricurvum sp.]